MSLDKTIQRVLELSADAHISRRGEVQDSPAFHALTGAIAAYGKVLAHLVALQTAAKNSPKSGASVDVPQPKSDRPAAVPSPFNSSLV